MTQPAGTIVTAMVTDLNKQAAFAQYQGITYRVITETPEEYSLGDTVKGLIYENKNDEKLLTPHLPPALSGEYIWAEVKESIRDLGAFVDIDLPEKDALVSKDNMPYIPSLWPHPGDQLFVMGTFDGKGRLWGKMLTRDEWVLRAKPGHKAMHNEDFEARVVLLQKAGTYVLLTTGELAFIHPSERVEEPRLGQMIKGRIIGIRDDRVLYGSTMPRAHEVIEDDAVMILETLKRMPNQELFMTIKSSPKEIDDMFAISKGRFKRAIGHLLKNHQIEQDDEKITLMK